MAEISETPEGDAPGHESAGPLSSLWQVLYGKCLLAYLRLKHRRLTNSLMALAVHLEDDLFPSMQDAGEPRLTLDLEDDDGHVCVRAQLSGRRTEFPGLEVAARVLRASGVEHVSLDTKLEYGQIVDAFMLLLHAAPLLADCTPQEDEYSGWTRRLMAASMCGAGGYHKFCSTMRYDRESRTADVAYTYCELFFTRAIRSTLQKRSRHGDHRALFAASPRLTILLLLLVGLCVAVGVHRPRVAYWLLVALGAAGAVAVGQFVYALGSQQYTQEHLDALVKGHMRTIGEQLDRLEESYSKLADLEKLRDDLVHMVVHDMKNPILSILADLDLLGEVAGDVLDEEGRESLEDVTAGAHRLFEMVNSLLDVSRFEDGKMPLNHQPCDMETLARDAINILGAMAREHTLTVTTHGGTACVCDEDVIRRVIVNLVSNALKYTPAGEKVCISARELGDMLELQVVDCGPGIPEHFREKIFEKFGQVEGKENHKMFSTGLGLTFCKLAVEAHGGEIGVDSEPGEGSTFWFRLPKPDAAEAHTDATADESEA
jgi:signal transduction histidine kinase